jgi:hypothetical protein
MQAGQCVLIDPRFLVGMILRLVHLVSHLDAVVFRVSSLNCVKALTPFYELYMTISVDSFVLPRNSLCLPDLCRTRSSGTPRFLLKM